MAAINSAASGKWITDASTVWVGGVAPGEGDTATILSGHNVEIDGNVTVGADTTTAAIQVNSGGKLFVPNTVAGNYTLTCKGDLKTDGIGGTIEFGAVVNPIPSNRTFTVKLNYSASLSDGEFGLIIAAGGTFTCQGTDRWSSGLTDPDRTLLAADAAVNDTHLHVADSTIWNADDYIAIAPTGITYSQYEIGQVASVSGTTINLKSFGGAGGGLAYAHTGTDPDVQAEIINLTRNVVIMNYDGVIGTPGNVAYVSFATTATVDVDWTCFRYMGENAAGKYGVVVATTSGSCSLNRCSFHHFEDGAVDIAGTTADNFTVQNCVGYLLSNSANRGFRIPATTQSTWTVNNIWLIGTNTDQSGLFYIASLKGTVSNLTVAGCKNACIYVNVNFNVTGTLTNVVAHSCNAIGIYLTGKNYSLSGIKSWHNGSYGIYLYNLGSIYLSTVDLYGNVTASLMNDYTVYEIDCDNLKSSGTTTQATPYGFLQNLYALGIIFRNAEFSYAAGVRVVHSSYDFLMQGYTTIKTRNCKFGATTAYFRYQNAPAIDSIVQCSRFNQSAGDHRTYMNNLPTNNSYGSILQTDATYYRTAAPSVKMTPTSATYKFGLIHTMQIPVASGANPTVSVYLRKSAAYNGNQPRLIVKRNDALGITSDTVLATYAGGNDVDTPPGNFNTLSGQPGVVTADGILDVYVDCDGTAGYVNLDDWRVS